MIDRRGSETVAAERLTENVEPAAARAVLIHCLAGELSPAAAIAQLFHLSGSRAAVREIVDMVTRNAAAASRTGDRLLQDRVDELTQMLVDPDRGVDRLDALDRRPQ